MQRYPSPGNLIHSSQHRYIHSVLSLSSQLGDRTTEGGFGPLLFCLRLPLSSSTALTTTQLPAVAGLATATVALPRFVVNRFLLDQTS